MRTEDLEAKLGVDDLAAANPGVIDLEAFPHTREHARLAQALAGFLRLGWKDNQAILPA
jgi:hypothetical protein